MSVSCFRAIACSVTQFSSILYRFRRDRSGRLLIQSEFFTVTDASLWLNLIHLDPWLRTVTNYIFSILYRLIDEEDAMDFSLQDVSNPVRRDCSK